MLVQAFVSCSLNCCVSALYSITDNLCQRLQSVQNAAARLVGVQFTHPEGMHCLPIRCWVEFMLTVLMFKTLQGLTLLWQMPASVWCQSLILVILHIHVLCCGGCCTVSRKKVTPEAMYDRNAKSQQILTEFCADGSDYICERTRKFGSEILFDSRVINLQISMTEYHSCPIQHY